MSKKYTVGETLEVSVKKIVPNGLGLCFAENLTVFVPLSVEGDQLRVEIRQLKGKTAFASIVEVLQPSAERVEPTCEYFGTCGGCDFQQISYKTQLDAKLGIIRDCLTRIGKIEFDGEIPIIASPEQFRYRLRAQWHADTKSGKVGYFKRQSHDVVDAKSCPILVQELEDRLNRLREEVPWSTYISENVNIEAACGNNGKTSVYSEELLEKTEELSFELNEDRFFFDAQTFFQGNKYLIEKLVEAAIGDAEGKTAIDLFCGAGLFSIPLGRKFDKVFAVETNEVSIGFAKKNVEHARLDNVELLQGRIKQFLYEGVTDGEDIDFLLLDPPRSGVKKGALDMIANLGSKHISYVSCNPSTLARDLRVLIDHGYAIDRICALDLFPQTHHVETVVSLRIKN